MAQKPTVSVPPVESPVAVLSLLRDQHRLLIKVAKTRDTIPVEVNNEYMASREALLPALRRYGIGDPFPWSSVWAYWNEEVGPVPTNKALLSKLSKRMRRAEATLQRLISREVTDWSTDIPPSWAAVEVRLGGMKDLFRRAVELDDYQDVSRRCREVILDALRLTHRPWMAEEGFEPKAADGKLMMDQVCSAVLSGSSNERVRKMLRSALDLAHEGTHSSSTRRLEAVAVAQATVTVVRTLQEVDRMVMEGELSRAGASRGGSVPAARLARHHPPGRLAARPAGSAEAALLG
jgi:Fe-S-cluster formation regulator IscX/YfhJ